MKRQLSRQNIIFIITDQWRGDCLSVSGHPVVETPNLDELARRGTNFTASYSNCPSCIAARASIFTGMRPQTHGRLGYRDQVPWRYEHMLGEELRQAGYQTACIGKTHFYPQGGRFGFEVLESYEAAQRFRPDYVNDYHEWLREHTNGRVDEQFHGADSNSWVARPSHLPEELHNNSWVITRGLEFLRRRDPLRPFFLNLSFHRPHPPIDPPQVFYDMYKDRELPPVPVGDWAAVHDLPAAGVNAWHGRISPEQLARARRAYYAQIAHIDNQIGRLRIKMRHMNLGPTWFIFSADHGEMLGDHHIFRKTYAYEGSAKTPLIICPPEGAPIHSCDAPVAQIDIMPTILDLAGAPVPKTVEGMSMLPLLAKTPAEAAWRPYVHGEHSACYDPDNAMQFLTDGKEKYIWFTTTGQEQLFDLREDAAETRDLARDPANEHRVALWRQRLIEMLAVREMDGLTDGEKLISGKSLPAVRPELLQD